MQAKARQCFKLLACPFSAYWQKSFGGGQRHVGIVFVAHAPNQRLGFEPRRAAHMAGRVAAVLTQQHTNVHLVRLGFQILKKAPHTVPHLAPLAVFVARVAVDHPVLLVWGELVPRGVARNTRGFSVAHQIVLALLPRGSLHGLDSARTQGELFVGNHQTIIHANDPTKPPARGASAIGRVE